MRISEELSPATRRLLWRVPRLSCKEIRLRVQFHRNGREIEGEESGPVPLIAHGGDDAGGMPIPQAVEADGPPLPSRSRGSPRTSGPEAGAGENADGERRGPSMLQCFPSSTVAPFPASLPRAAFATLPDLGGAPAFVPPRK